MEVQDIRKSPVTVYQEDIYLGYRYFDTFRKLVLYPFGYGMSYTSFTILPKEMKQEKEEVEFITEVTNSGNYAGKETIQLYLSCSGTESEKPEKELKGFAKTRLLAPGEKQNISIRISMQDLADMLRHLHHISWKRENISFLSEIHPVRQFLQEKSR